jgi:hypothetical protein
MKREPNVIVRGPYDDALHAKAADGGIVRCQIPRNAIFVQIKLLWQRVHPLHERTVIGLDGFVRYGANGNSVVHDITENDGKPEECDIWEVKTS